jgi:hypothetical protein
MKTSSLNGLFWLSPSRWISDITDVIMRRPVADPQQIKRCHCFYCASRVHAAGHGIRSGALGPLLRLPAQLDRSVDHGLRQAWTSPATDASGEGTRLRGLAESCGDSARRSPLFNFCVCWGLRWFAGTAGTLFGSW